MKFKKFGNPRLLGFLMLKAPGRSLDELVTLVNAAGLVEVQLTKQQLNQYLNYHQIAFRHENAAPITYTPEMLEFARQNVQGRSFAELAEMMRRRFGCKFTEKIVAGYCKRYGLCNGRDTRFPRGIVPANKGQKMPDWVRRKCEKGFFKPGRIPENTLPIGSLVKSTDGYWWRKIKEASRTRGGWVQEHRRIYEATYGPISAGMMISFKDNNPDNLAPENLILVSRGEHACVNARGLRRIWSPETAETCVGIARLKIAIRQRKKK